MIPCEDRNEAVKISYTKLWITWLIKKVLTAINVEISRQIKKSIYPQGVLDKIVYNQNRFCG